MAVRLDDPSLKSVFDYDQVEAALCLWEEMLAAYQRAKAGDPIGQELVEMWDEMGAYEMRAICVSLVPKLQEEWLKVRYDFDGSFDWEFVPAFLHRAHEHGWLKEFA